MGSILEMNSTGYNLSLLQKTVQEKDLRQLSGWLKSGWNPDTLYTVWKHLGVYHNVVSAIHLVTEADWQEGVRILIKAGANINIPSSFKNIRRMCGRLCTSSVYSNTPLMTATERGNLAIVCMLIKANADSNARDDTTGNTALRIAINKSHVDIAQLLIHAGADVNSTSKQMSETDGCGNSYQTPRSLLIAAIRQFNNTTVPLNKEKLNGERPRSERNVWLRVIQKIVQHGANINSKGYGMESAPLVESVESSDTRVLKLLLKSGVMVNQETHTVLSEKPPVNCALDLACFSDNTAAIRLLIQHGADISSISGNLFQYMMDNKYYESARLIVDAGFSMSPEIQQFINQLHNVYLQRIENQAIFQYVFYPNKQKDSAMCEELVWLYNYVHQPKNLTWLCRTKLRNKCFMHLPQTTKSTGLPKILCDYVLCYDNSSEHCYNCL